MWLDHPHIARIVRHDFPCCWLYGTQLSPDHDLPPCPQLDDRDLDVLQPLPSDATLLGPGTPFEGCTYVQVASTLDAAGYFHQVLSYAMDSTNELHRETHRFAFYLYGRCKLVHSTAMRQHKAGTFRPEKRPANPDDMIAHRHIRVPLQHDPRLPDSVQLHDCEVMMVHDEQAAEPADEADDSEAIAHAYATCEDGLPGLAILDSGCTELCTVAIGPNGSRLSSRSLDFLQEDV